MKKHIAILYIITGITGLFSSCKQYEMEIRNLRCEYLANPLSVESKSPLLSWELQSLERGKKQTAYRILAASDLSLLNEKEADFWDSGIVETDQSVQVKYEGKKLSSRQKIYWKVMVWDENNQSGSWSDVATWSMGLLHVKDWTAGWITNTEDLYPDSAVTFPAPFFRKEFVLDKQVRQAKAYICGLGFYEMYVNGQKVGTQVLAPAVTNYDKRTIRNSLYFYDDQSSQRALYNTFDVTDLLRKGDNTIGVILGNGWYNQRDRTVEGCLWYNSPRLLLQMEVEYSDGSVQTVQTDNTWKYSDSPILHDAIFTGEIYDARRELENWHSDNYNDDHWKQALPCESPSGELHPQLAPYDEITRTVKPVSCDAINDSVYLYTIPEMVSGWAELSVTGKTGDKIHLRFIGEENNDFGQSDTYILKGNGMETWEPRFTWHAFRFIEITSPDVKMDKNSITVKVVHTKPAKNGTFACSNELFNKINEAYIRTQEANFHGSISSDCPHRERIAYTGDGQIVVESSILSYDMTRFYGKWFDDMKDAQNKNTGYVPHTAPFAGGGGGPAWGSAYIIMPWYYYLYYGDKHILNDHYQGMKQWVAYLGTRTDERGIIVREEPDGWCLGDWCTPDEVEIPEALVNTCYYYHCADLLGKIALVLNRNEDARFYNQLSEKIKNDFNEVYFNPDTNAYWENRQGAGVFPLAFGMTPEGKKEAVFQSLLANLEKTNYHFDTGILATPLLVKVLSENNRTDLAYKLMNQRTEPGYGYLMDEKNSCLWERWDGKASRCHPMFGSVIAWFYNTLGGISPDIENPGMKHFIIAPKPVDELDFCKTSYRSVYGLIRSEWSKSGDEFRLEVDIPSNTTATIYFPETENKTIYESGKNITATKYIQHGKTHLGISMIEIGSGSYSFDIR